MAKAQKQLPPRITTVDQALEAMGGDDRVATWLHVRSSEIDGMRHRGHVDRGWFAHFYVTLRRSATRRRPSCLGLRAGAP
jgi:hypothetical protein